MCGIGHQDNIYIYIYIYIYIIVKGVVFYIHVRYKTLPNFSESLGKRLVVW